MGSPARGLPGHIHAGGGRNHHPGGPAGHLHLPARLPGCTRVGRRRLRPGPGGGAARRRHPGRPVGPAPRLPRGAGGVHALLAGLRAVCHPRSADHHARRAGRRRCRDLRHLHLPAAQHLQRTRAGHGPGRVGCGRLRRGRPRPAGRRHPDAGVRLGLDLLRQRPGRCRGHRPDRPGGASAGQPGRAASARAWTWPEWCCSRCSPAP